MPKKQFMASFFSVAFRYPFFFSKLLFKFSFQANSSLGSLGHIRAPSRSGRTGVTPGSGLFPASSPTDGWRLAACLLVCCIITTESIFKSYIYQVVIIVWLAYLSSQKKTPQNSPLALICLSHVIHHMQKRQCKTNRHPIWHSGTFQLNACEGRYFLCLHL